MKGEKEEVLNVTVYPDTSALQILYLLLQSFSSVFTSETINSNFKPVNPKLNSPFEAVQ